MKKQWFVLSAKAFIIYLCLSGQNVSVEGMLLDLFAEKDRHGMSIRVEVSDNECSNFPISWSSKAASVNTLGSCIQFYDEPFCKGALTIIQPFHTIHQMDLSLINFGQRIQSSSACGPKIKTGRYVVQNAADASILTVTSKYGGFARAFTANASNLITKAQQWDVVELSNSEYSLKPREYADNYPVSYDEEMLKIGKIKKKLWKLMSVGRSRYLIKNEPSQRCLYKTEDDKVEEHDCRIWSPNQEWVLKEIFGNAKPEKKNSATGPGVNFNILSKVASYIPPTKPPPQFSPIYYNVSALAQLKRKTSPAPYTVRKKIKRGPRPQSRPIGILSQIRPPGLRERPALSSKISNNNKFLLQSPLLNLKEFEPSDDNAENYAFYQQVLLAKKKHEQDLKNRLKLPPFPPPNIQSQRPTKQQDDEDNEDDDEQRRKKKRKKQKEEESEEDDVENEDDAEEEDETEGDEDDDDSDEEKKSQKQKQPPKQPPTQRPYNPYDINFNQTRPQLEDEVSAGFLTSMFSKVKSGLGSFVPSVQIPFISSSNADNNTAVSVDNKAQGSHPPYQYAEEEGEAWRPPPPHSSKKRRKQRPSHPHLMRPRPPKELQKGSGPGLRLPKRKSSTTTTTTPKPSWFSMLG